METPSDSNHCRFQNSEVLDVKKRTLKRASFWEEEGGTLALRSRPECGLFRWSSVLRRQLAHSSGKLLAVFLAVLHGNASTSSQITVALCLRVQREARLLLLAANFPGNHHSVRINRSDRTLGEMR